jgi:histidinol-phosphate aminotransferase
MVPVRACVTPFSVTEAAQVGAMVSLDAREELDARVATTIAERERVAGAVRALGFDVPEAQGNFVWLPLGDRTAEVVAALGAQDRPILVRPFAGEGVRVTIGTAAENDAFLAALTAL